MVIFLSYARLDESVVKVLVQGLEAAHREIWFDHDLGGGEVWWVKILQSIRQADVVIFALSDNALHSKPCRAELDYAIALERTILPIKVGPVANFRANPLSALQTIEFRPADSYSAFEIIAAIDDAAKRLRPLPQVLPPEPQIPFAYIGSLSKQIDNGELSARAQLDAVDELRKAYREETDASVHGDILAILRSLKSKPWATLQAAGEVDAVLAWAESRRQATPAGATPGPVAGPTEDPELVVEATESSEAAERLHKREFERNMIDALMRQEQERPRRPEAGAQRPTVAPPPPPPLEPASGRSPTDSRFPTGRPPATSSAPEPAALGSAHAGPEGPRWYPPGTPPARPPSPRRGRRGLWASLLVLLVLVVVVGARLAMGPGITVVGPENTSGTSYSPSAEVSPTAEETRSTTELLAHVPEAIRPSCKPYPAPGWADTKIAVKCGTGDGISLQYYLYTSTSTMNGVFDVHTRSSHPSGLCADNREEVGSYPAGRYSCYVSNQSPKYRVLSWTHDETKILTLALHRTATFPRLVEASEDAGPD